MRESSDRTRSIADHLLQTAAAIKLPISGFDGDMCEFAIGREKIKQITNVFKPYKDDPLPVRVTVDRLHTSLGKWKMLSRSPS